MSNTVNETANTPQEKNRVTMIFGAGASRPFFKDEDGKDLLTTETLTDLLFSKSEWEKLFFKLELTAPLTFISNIVNLFDCIKKIESSYGLESNFETLIDFLDHLCIVFMKKEGDKGMKISPKYELLIGNFYQKLNELISKINSEISSLPPPQNKKIDFSYLSYLTRLLITNYIIALKNDDNLKGNQRGLFNDLVKKNYMLSLVSLNYDNAIFNSLPYGLDFVTGFEKREKLNNSLFFPGKISDFNKNEHYYFPLHGHIRFSSRIKGDGEEGNITSSIQQNCVVKMFPSAEDAFSNSCKCLHVGVQNHYLSHGGPNFYFDKYSTDSISFNKCIITGQSKFTSLNGEPYNQYYLATHNSIINSSILIIAGYSFGDEHLNILIRDFLTYNDKNKIMIVDFLNEYKKESTFLNPQQINYRTLENLYSVLKNSTIVRFLNNTFINSQSRKQLSTISQDPIIDSSNYLIALHEDGWLREDRFNKRIYLYLKGYNEFLKDYEQILDVFLKNE